MPREVNLTLTTLLNGTGVLPGELADRLGVSRATVATYLENRWTVLDRTVLERLIDFFQCDLSAAVQAHESPFFDPYRPSSATQPECLFLCRPDSKTVAVGRVVGQRDYQAIERVVNFLKNAVDGLVALEDTVSDRGLFQLRLEGNCVVLGSPWVNLASELAICHVFKVQPFSGTAKRLPFSFKVTKLRKTLPRTSICEISRSGDSGIWLRDEKELLKSDQWPLEDFRRLRIIKAKDCGIVIVHNHLVAGVRRKLIVLSGFTGVGTEAAASALADNFRDLEPRENGETVWGVVEVTYRTQAHSMKREIVKYNWRYRCGGRCPIAFTLKK